MIENNIACHFIVHLVSVIFSWFVNVDFFVSLCLQKKPHELNQHLVDRDIMSINREIMFKIFTSQISFWIGVSINLNQLNSSCAL